MRIFNIQINVPSSSLVAQAFWREPQNFYEEIVGSLFLVGEIPNPSAQEKDLLVRLWNVLQASFFQQKIENQATAFKRTVLKANEFFQELASMGHIGWLEKINLALLALKIEESQISLRFTKVGEEKIILERGGKISFLHEKIEPSSIEPFPLTVFTKQAHTTILPGDRLFIFGPSLSEFVSSFQLVEKLSFQEKITEKELRRLFKKEAPSSLKGELLLIDLREKGAPSLPPVLIKEQQNIKEKLSFLLQKIKEKLPFLSFLYTLLAPLSHIPPFSYLSALWAEIKKLKKEKLLLLFFLVLFISLLVGTASERKRKKEIARDVQSFQKLKAKALGLKEASRVKEANLLLKDLERNLAEIWFLSRTLEEKEKAYKLQQEFLQLREKLNNIQKITEPKEYYAFSEEQQKSAPQKIDSYRDKVLVLYKIKKAELLFNNKNEEIELPFYFKEAVFLDENTIAFLDYKGNVYIYQDGYWGQPELKGFISHISSFLGTLYALDNTTCAIWRIEIPQEASGAYKIEKWSKEEFSCKNYIALGAGPTFFTLTKQGVLEEWKQGIIYRRRNLSFWWPPFSSETKILNSLGSKYLYLWDPSNSRMALFDKEKFQIEKQWLLPKSLQIKDGALTEKGSLLLLGTEKVFVIEAPQ